MLQSAQTLADHAARSGASSNRIEKEDVELAIKMRKLYEFFEAPPRDVRLPPPPPLFAILYLWGSLVTFSLDFVQLNTG